MVVESSFWPATRMSSVTRRDYLPSCLTGNTCNRETQQFRIQHFRTRHFRTQELPLIPAIALRRISVVILVLLTLAHFGLAQGAASPAAEKPVSKVTYLLVGRLFDATGDNVRENMVIAVEDERIKSVASAAD